MPTFLAIETVWPKTVEKKHVSVFGRISENIESIQLNNKAFNDAL